MQTRPTPAQLQQRSERAERGVWRTRHKGSYVTRPETDPDPMDDDRVEQGDNAITVVQRAEPLAVTVRQSSDARARLASRRRRAPRPTLAPRQEREHPRRLRPRRPRLRRLRRRAAPAADARPLAGVVRRAGGRGARGVDALAEALGREVASSRSATSSGTSYITWAPRSACRSRRTRSPSGSCPRPPSTACSPSPTPRPRTGRSPTDATPSRSGSSTRAAGGSPSSPGSAGATASSGRWSAGGRRGR